jgi:hypothetical protein
MRIIELTKYQHGNRVQDPGIAINVEHIINISVFTYSYGDTVSVIELPNRQTIEVTETYRDILNTLRSQLK